MIAGSNDTMQVQVQTCHIETNACVSGHNRTTGMSSLGFITYRALLPGQQVHFACKWLTAMDPSKVDQSCSSAIHLSRHAHVGALLTRYTMNTGIAMHQLAADVPGLLNDSNLLDDSTISK